MRVRLRRRPPAVLWRSVNETAVLIAGDIGFAGASESDRLRTLNGFRRLLDGLDAQLQVIIESKPGPDSDAQADPCPIPADFDEMRAADLWFADQVARLRSTCERSIRFVIDVRHVQRLQAALHEMGASSARSDSASALFGQEQSDRMQHQQGWSRSWYVDRLPGTELEPGWLSRLI